MLSKPTTATTWPAASAPNVATFHSPLMVLFGVILTPPLPFFVPSTTITKRILDIITVDHYGPITAYDEMDTHASGATDASTRPLHAAEAGEAHKRYIHPEYKDKVAPRDLSTAV